MPRVNLAAVRPAVARRGKNAIRRTLRTWGLDVVRHRPPLGSRLDVLGYVVADLDRTSGPLTFLQVGANDGVRADPLQHLVRRHRMTGLLVEPLPDMFQRLRATYADVPGVEFEQCAVTPEDGTVTLHRVAPGAPLPDWMQGMASLDRDHLTKFGHRFPGLERHLLTEQVPGRRLGGIVAEHGLQDVDVLLVDTEGHDCTIVLSGLDAGLRPTLVQYEYAHAPAREQAACQTRLVDLGYRLVEVGQDLIAVRRPPGPEA